MTDKKSTLIIGFADHPHADASVNWGEDVYIGDHDVVIVVVPTLSREVLGLILGQKVNYLDNLREQIIEAQIKKNIELVCIMGPKTSVSPGSKGEISNYAWCPVIPDLSNTPGRKVIRESKSINMDYLDGITGWEMLYDGNTNNTQFKFPQNSAKSFRVQFKNLLQNDLGRAIAFQLHWRVFDYSQIFIDPMQPITFLPALADMQEGISSIIDHFSMEEIDPAPEWADDVELPGESEIASKIKQSKEQITAIEEELQSEQLKLQQLTEYKKLLYLNGKPLEAIVEQSFTKLGIALNQPDVDNIEDRNFIDDGVVIPIEIRGTDSRGMNEKDLGQLIARIADQPVSEKYKSRGIFIFNPNRLIAPDQRKGFEHNIIKKAEAFSIGLISTEQIFHLVSEELKGKHTEHITEVIFNTVGVLKMPPYEQDKLKK